MPYEFNRLGNLSMERLLADSGYLNCPEMIQIDDIRRMLLEFPKCIDDWAEYSEDKRSDCGWYLETKSGKPFMVKYYHQDKKKRNAFIYGDRVTACAAFIKLEAEEIKLALSRVS